ncbi:hypothetical protein C8F04DRAFT_1191800 [Mycena alexandri]|uniref:Uncharacterized protein n=1 Tax=Mycena alexandri TaxID=1745969 RepID=A0AAD6SGN7_9AGAR|nr:hypothetical protein C8F04DRAFT_1191800 [Mycena alexandri]
MYTVHSKVLNNDRTTLSFSPLDILPEFGIHRLREINSIQFSERFSAPVDSIFWDHLSLPRYFPIRIPPKISSKQHFKPSNILSEPVCAPPLAGHLQSYRWGEDMGGHWRISGCKARGWCQKPKISPEVFLRPDEEERDRRSQLTFQQRNTQSKSVEGYKKMGQEGESGRLPEFTAIFVCRGGAAAGEQARGSGRGGCESEASGGQQVVCSLKLSGQNTAERR